MKLKNNRNHAEGTTFSALTMIDPSEKITLDSDKAKEIAENKISLSGYTAANDKKKTGKNNKKLYIGIAVVLLAVAFAWWYLKKS